MNATIDMRTGRERWIGYPTEDNGSHPFNGRRSPGQRPAGMEGHKPQAGAETAGPFAQSRGRPVASSGLISLTCGFDSRPRYQTEPAGVPQ